MLVGAAMLARPAPAMACAWLVCFAAANAIGSWLWRRRDGLRPYPAIQLLLLACGATSLSAWFLLDFFLPGVIQLMGWSRSGMYFALLIVPALMAWSALLEHSTKSKSQPPDPVT